MAPKKQASAREKHVFSEVEKAFYELQLADCNRKVSRLRKAVDDLEIRNEELQKAYDKLDEDRADIITFLKKTLTLKNEENSELKEKIKSLEELREEETTKFSETVTELEKNFTKMKDQLTSENKLLAGKLNTLEEFRAIREDLMKKFDSQQRAYEDQEMKYKRIIYNNEKKFVVGKDKLKKEMEERLLQLAQEFQDASELRIAASTHRVNRENIALNNQLDSLLMTQTKVAEQNEKFREDERAARCAMEVAEEERDKAINKSIVQLKVIDQLTSAFEDVKKQKALYEKKQFDSEKIETKVRQLTKENENLIVRVRILEQNLHATLGEQNKSTVDTAKLLRERETFKNILKESAFAIQAALKMDHWSTIDPSREILDRKIVLNRILDVVNQYREATRAESMESLVSLSKIYEKGDLGFDVKKVSTKSLSGLAATASIQSFEGKRSAISASSVSSSKVSLRTIPSIEVIPVDEEGSLPTPKDSLPSFTVGSLHSSMIIGTAEEENDMIKILEMSKMDVQRSLMADLALSHISRTISGLALSVNVMSDKGAPSTMGEEHHETVPNQDEMDFLQAQVHFGEPTLGAEEPTKDTDVLSQTMVEPSQELAEPLKVNHETDEEEKKKNAKAE